MRLSTRRRNVLTTRSLPNTGRNLLDAALAGGAQACGRAIGGIAENRRADLLVLNCQHPRLHGRSRDNLVDSWIFSGNQNLVRDVYVGGKRVIENGRHADEDMIARNYRDTLDRLGQEI